MSGRVLAYGTFVGAPAIQQTVAADRDRDWMWTLVGMGALWSLLFGPVFFLAVGAWGLAGTVFCLNAAIIGCVAGPAIVLPALQHERRRQEERLARIRSMRR